MASALDALLDSLQKADGGMAMNAKEFAEAQYGLPFKHYCLQYLFGSTGMRYGGFYLTAGKPKSCKSPFVFYLGKECCENNGISFIYELEGKASPTLISSMLSDHPDWIESSKSPFKLIKGLTLDGASKHLTKSVLPVFQKMGSYSTPLLVDWDSISGAAMSDVVEKIEKEGVASKGYYDKSHVMKYLSENWSVLVGNLPVIFVGVLQEKTKAGATPMSAPEKSYGGGDSQLFKTGTLLSFGFRNMPTGNGKIVTIKTALNGFADSRKIETKFVWDQFGSLETESQGHKWLWAECSARCLANPTVVGDLRDIVDVKLADSGLVSCKQLGVDKVTPDEFEAALFANETVLDQLYHYQKIERIKTPDQYQEYINKFGDRAAAIKEAEKQAKAEEKAKKEAEAKAKEAEKQARKEAKAKKAAEKADPLKALQAMGAQQ